jgi:hypothetical protein
MLGVAININGPHDASSDPEQSAAVAELLDEEGTKDTPARVGTTPRTRFEMTITGLERSGLSFPAISTSSMYRSSNDESGPRKPPTARYRALASKSERQLCSTTWRTKLSSCGRGHVREVKVRWDAGIPSKVAKDLRRPNSEIL